MPYEMTITDANTLSAETIGFGDNKDMAESVFESTWNELLSAGYHSIHNAKTPLFMEFVQPKGGIVKYVELSYRPEFDFANALRLINMLALQALYPNHFHTGLLMADTVGSEQAWKNARYKAVVTSPDGRSMNYPLPLERADAIKRFNQLVRERQNSGWRVMRCPDADLKYKALDTNGAVTLEFVEVQA